MKNYAATSVDPASTHKAIGLSEYLEQQQSQQDHCCLTALQYMHKIPLSKQRKRADRAAERLHCPVSCVFEM